MNCTVQNCASCNSKDECQICLSDYKLIDGQCASDCSAQVQHCSFCLSGPTCVQCSQGYTLIPSNHTCLECSISSCSSCSSANVCSSCIDELLPSTDGSLCVSCSVEACVSCSSNDYCQVCNGTLVVYNGECLICTIPNCHGCEPDQLKCKDCFEGYTLNQTTGDCDPDCTEIEHCSQCSAPNQCSVCSLNYSLNPSANNCLYNCGIPNCFQCQEEDNQNVCLSCVQTYKLLGAVCQQLCSIPGCTQCREDVWGQCQTCSQGMSVSSDGSTCVYCQYQGCTSCDSQANCNCPPGEIFSNQQCMPCAVDNCQECFSANLCGDGCYPGYTFNNQYTSTHDQCIACSDPCATCYPDGSC